MDWECIYQHPISKNAYGNNMSFTYNYLYLWKFTVLET